MGACHRTLIQIDAIALHADLICSACELIESPVAWKPVPGIVRI